MKYLIILAVLLSILGCQAPQKSPPRQPFMEALDSALQAERVPGCAVMVIREGAVLLEEYSGEAEVSFAQPVTERTVFSINSIAKVFAGTTVMQLADRGMIQLQDSLGAYLDSLPASWQGITLRQLLNHTSGLPDIEDVAAGGVIGGQGEAHVWELVKQQPLVGTPGTKFRYIATHYGLIQQVIEQVSGMDYLSFLDSAQFEPLGITNITFGSSFEVVPHLGPTYSLYQRDPTTGKTTKGTELQKIREAFFPSLYADAGAFATLRDLGQWVMHLQAGGFVTKESQEEMWTAQPNDEGSIQGFGGFLNGYGIGWPVMHRREHPGVLAIGGGRAALAIYPEEELCVILLTNLTGSSPHRIVEKLAPLLWQK